MKNIAKDFVYFSLSLFLLKNVASGAGVSLLSTTTLSIEEGTISGILLGITGIGLEWVILWVQRDLRSAGRVISLELIYKKLKQSAGFTLNKKQKTLYHFGVRPIHAESPGEKFLRKLDHKFSLRFGRRQVKASWILTVVILICTVSLIFGSVVRRKQIILAPVYSVFVERKWASDLSPYTRIISSEQMEELVEGVDYAIPIASVVTIDFSFHAPLSDRLSTLNSTDFLVSLTGEYLAFEIDKRSAEINISSSTLFPVEYNQSSNSNYEYRGFFREAEFYFALYERGYTNITAVTHFTPSATIQSIHKDIYAEKRENEAILISVYLSWESIPIEDKTILMTKDATLVNEIDFLIRQTKVVTSFMTIEEIPSPPFRHVVEP